MRAWLLLVAGVIALPTVAAGDELAHQRVAQDTARTADIMSAYRALPIDIDLPPMPINRPYGVRTDFRADPPFLDRAAPVNVWRERRSVEFVRLWSNRFARVYFGVSPTGFAGLCISPRIRPRKPKAVESVRDYSEMIERLTTRVSD
ncbi:MAG: hypothetical protein AAGH76_14370 [Pseudomonadota bacterium]